MRRLVLASLISLAAVNSLLAEDIAPERIIDATTGDWNKDGRQDLALLAAPEEEGDDIGIYIYLRDKEHPLLRLAAAAPAKVSGNASLDGMFGQDPSIKAMPNGSIAVHSENSGIGRDRWEQTLTIADRDGSFVVAGYTYSHYDTLDPKNTGRCDYNLLGGRVAKDGKDEKAEAATVKIEDWKDDTGQKACGLGEQ